MMRCIKQEGGTKSTQSHILYQNMCMGIVEGERKADRRNILIVGATDETR